jgi:hypothetical protein
MRQVLQLFQPDSMITLTLLFIMTEDFSGQLLRMGIGVFGAAF